MSKPTSKAESIAYMERKECDYIVCNRHRVKKVKKMLSKSRRRHDKDLVEFFEWRLKNGYV